MPRPITPSRIKEDVDASKRELTLRQKELARHALGLDGRRKKSYRNRFVCGPGHPDHAAWVEIAEAGLAKRWPKWKFVGGDDFFALTRAGAELALNPGESLDPEDFPPPLSDGGA